MCVCGCCRARIQVRLGKLFLNGTRTLNSVKTMRDVDDNFNITFTLIVLRVE